jgi:peptide chain release factor 1
MDESNKYLVEEIAKVEKDIIAAKELLADEAFKEEAIKEISLLEQNLKQLQTALLASTVVAKTSQITHVFNTIMIEARPGVGGDEAKIWLDDLLRMYTRFAATKNLKQTTLDENIIQIQGKGVYDLFKWETGVHRVQRVPETEKAGRIHTSTASIVVLPEVPEREVVIKDDDLEWQFTTGGGHGGQNVNKVATAVRLTHKPSGIVTTARQERSQEQNRKIALALLRSQLWEIEEEKKMSDLKDKRAKIGKSMRSEKIRTFNYPQNRVTDHRIGKSWYSLDTIIEGDLGDVLQSVKVLDDPNFSFAENDTQTE